MGNLQIVWAVICLHLITTYTSTSSTYLRRETSCSSRLGSGVLFCIFNSSSRRILNSGQMHTSRCCDVLLDRVACQQGSKDSPSYSTIYTGFSRSG
ncbi:hypothetical protein GGS24DRAFT_453785 [Hypoxylon argillaceum]|nr:hypothetical protein GGS24DRAFT_453785 [Hypoxylon argillaceum]